jgi:hypothetical protein
MSAGTWPGLDFLAAAVGRSCEIDAAEVEGFESKAIR